MTPRLQDELRQRKPFRSTAHEAGLALLRTADLVRRAGTTRLAPHDLTLQQYNVLRILRGAGEAMPTLEIAERMLEHAPGITRLIDRLVLKELVERTPCAHDRRQVLCRITPRGEALLALLDPIVHEGDEILAGALSADDLATLVRLLDRAREALAADLETAPPAVPGRD